MRRLPILFAALLALTPTLFGQSAMLMHKALTAEGERLRAWAAERAVVDAVKAQNARNVSMDDIRRIDDDWKAGKIRRDILTGPCADRLRALALDRAHYVEIFVSDNQGALVCANKITSDYWQGDEDKWLRAFDEGRGRVFVDRPRFDESAKATLGAISVPIFDGTKAVGVLTAGVITDKLPDLQNRSSAQR